ncbi:PEPxxWA-CTERM sorting domain-containing protein [Sphingopyxis sp.]|uniref:PEPxxWA-CTERM sorting domain-containing protein n=1 Tax=Sphingopyxis sp. TaxID=1908224 RepID=UPI0010F95DC1|nr:PEPxxWA-CTERM sorting domain-containing protein [Sphingopyxis sp.]MBR2173632.1 PEP-CTERM sorting domain-containing protein [Sphingopyxis sp.]
MRKFWVTCSFAALVAASPAQAASLIGNTVTCSQVGAGSSYSCLFNSAVVGGGREFEVGAAPNAAIGLDFNGGGLKITNISGTSLSLSATILSLTNVSAAFSSANLLNSSITGFDSSDVALQNGDLRLNFVNTAWERNSSANIALDTAAAVPEPSSWAMMFLGFGAMGAAMRSRRRQKVTVRYA